MLKKKKINRKVKIHYFFKTGCDGEEFSCIVNSEEEAKKLKNEWLAKKGCKRINKCI